MRITHEQMTAGLVQYIHTAVLPGIQDAGVKAVILTAASALKRDPEMIVRLIDSTPMAGALLHKEGETIDPGPMLDAIVDGAREAGSIELTIPRVPLLMRSDCHMRLTADDLSELKNRIEHG